MMFVKYKDENNEVDMLDNQNDILKTEFKLLDKGLTVLKERKYARLFWTSWKTIFGLVVAALLTTVAVKEALLKLHLLK